MENNYKRQSRQLSDETKKKISQALAHRSKSDTHKQAISNGMKKYWSDDDNFPEDRFQKQA